MPAELNTTALKNSVQAFPENGMVRSSYSTWFVPSEADMLPAWYSRSCDYALRLYLARLHNTLAQGAINNWNQQFLSTPFKITGEDAGEVEHYQSLFLEMDFGDGIDSGMGKFLLDFQTQNFGGVIEIIGPGDPSKPLTGRPIGLAHLDAYQCWATGSKEYPVAYESSESGQLHFLHHTRVIRLTDMPSANERVYGYGMCGLYRILSVVNAQILMGKHQNEKLSDLPPAGLLKLGNVKPGYWQTIKDRYHADSNKGGSQVWNSIIEIESIDPTNPIEVEFVSFSQLPDNFNYKEYLEAHVNMIALALNMDPQDIWPLTGAALGTGTQSKILNAKARGKGYGYMLKRLERVWNRCVLPRDMEFAYEYKDEEQDREVAETAQLWIQIARDMPGDEKQKRQLLANQVEALADVYLDPDGSLIELPDDDPKDPEQDDTIAPDFTPLDTTGTPAETTTATSGAPIATLKEAAAGHDAGRVLRLGDEPVGRLGYVERWPGLRADLQTKELQSTRLDFEADVADAIAGAQDGDTGRRRFGIVMRALINRHGTQAFKDGLAAGGVEDDALSSDDQSTVIGLVAEQSGYVSGFADALFDGSQADPDTRASMWFNKSIVPFYQAGLQSADQNGVYEWVYGDTEHCADCVRLNGQKHRLFEWVDSGYMPQSDELECNGFNCKCSLEKTSGRTRGGF